MNSARATIASLSNAPITDCGPVSRRFLAMGMGDFHEACNWLQTGIPYGSNSRSGDLNALFEDHCGTCTTKHGVAAALAAELDLPVRKYIVFYPLDGSVRPGADTLLAQHGLRFVPASHCILMEGPLVMDLTWGNATGKLKDLEDFDLFFRVDSLPATEEMAEMAQIALSYYRRRDAALAQAELAVIDALRKECSRLKAVVCDC